MIWTNFKLQSVCTYQLLFYLLPMCSTCYKDSRDYKFVSFGHVELKLWIIWFKQDIWVFLKLRLNFIQNIYYNMAWLDRKFYKISIGILFVIFGPIFDFIQILQAWHKFCGLKLNLNCFKQFWPGWLGVTSGWRMDGACRDAAHAATRQDVVGWRLGWWVLPWVRGNGGRGGRLGRRKGCRRGTPAVLGDGEVMTGLGRMRRGRCDERRGPAKLDSTARRDRRRSARRRGSGIDGEVSLVGLRRRRAANDVQID